MTSSLHGQQIRPNIPGLVDFSCILSRNTSVLEEYEFMLCLKFANLALSPPKLRRLGMTPVIDFELPWDDRRSAKRACLSPGFFVRPFVGWISPHFLAPGCNDTFLKGSLPCPLTLGLVSRIRSHSTLHFLVPYSNCTYMCRISFFLNLYPYPLCPAHNLAQKISE